MADLEPTDCCSPTAEADCCDPSEKGGCCTPGSSSCGCGADEATAASAAIIRATKPH